MKDTIRLLKDLPGVPAGREVSYYVAHKAYIIVIPNYRYQFSKELVENHPDWFEEVADANTIPQISETTQ